MESLGKGQRMVGEKLMKLRKKRGMSQQEVASALGVTRQTVSNWECDQGAPSLDKAADLARLCGVSLDDLVADEVEVVVADPDQAAGKPRDLHVLRHLEGKQCRICYRYTHDEIDIFKAVSMPEKARVLDVSDGWLRVEHELGGGAPWSKKETAVRLIDIDIIDSVLAWPNEMIVRMRQRARRRSRDGAVVGHHHRAARLRFEQAAQEGRFLERERIRSLRARAEGERRVRRLPASQVARLRVCVHSLGARAHFC